MSPSQAAILDTTLFSLSILGLFEKISFSLSRDRIGRQPILKVKPSSFTSLSPFAMRILRENRIIIAESIWQDPLPFLTSVLYQYSRDVERSPFRDTTNCCNAPPLYAYATINIAYVHRCIYKCIMPCVPSAQCASLMHGKQWYKPREWKFARWDSLVVGWGPSLFRQCK